MAELDTNVAQENAENTEAQENTETVETPESPELARVKAELAKMKAANDKLAKENAEKTKLIRAKQNADEIAAEEAKALQQSMKEELEQLRKEKAVAATTAKILPLVANDSAVAGQIAEYLYGAEDVESALAAIQKSWLAKEKALKLEYGKIQPPAAGSTEGPTMTREQLDGMNYNDRARFAREHMDEYRKLMGRA